MWIEFSGAETHAFTAHNRNKSSTSLSTAAAADNGLKTMMKAFVLDVINSLSTAQGRDDLKKIIIINMLPHVVML